MKKLLLALMAITFVIGNVNSQTKRTPTKQAKTSVAAKKKAEAEAKAKTEAVQEVNNHIEFMGVRLGEDLDETIELFKEKGFYPDEHGKNPKGQGFYGKYWKFNKVHLYLYAPTEIGKVVEASLSIESQLFYYEELVSSLDEKYGSHRTKKTLINVELYWDLPNGNRIVLEKYSSFISLKYQDYLKAQQDKQKASESNKDL